MKIRDLQQYVQLICGEVPEQIGVASDRLLTYLRSQRYDLSFLKNTANFAGETHIQIFYEFLQNANDAKGSQMYFYFDDENLLVINNGKPFYTDQLPLNKGQLRGFLSKENADKDNDPETIGKYGLGSKLLYDFFRNNNSLDKGEHLYDKLVNEHKAPILFSWSSATDLEFDDTTNFIAKDCQNIDYPLLTRIIYTYYPAMPNEEKTDYLGNKVNLFPKNEQVKFFTFFQKCIEKYKINKTALTSGSALYITLGEGQAELLQKELDEGKIVEDIAISLFFLKNTDRVQINDKAISKAKVKENFFIENLPTHKLPQYQPKEDEENIIKIPKLELLFPKETQNIDEKVSNFFLYFPILKLQLGYKFIINSNTFSTKPDRQDIAISENEQHNRKTIEAIGMELYEYVKRLRENKQQDKHIAFFKCFLDSENKADYEFYGEHIYGNLYNAFIENIPTETGFRDSAESVKIKDTAFKVNPKDLGLSEDWLHPDLESYQEQIQDIFDNIDTWNIIDLLNAAEYENIVQWIKKLSKKDYQTLLDELVANTSQTNDIAYIPFIKFQDGEYYSLEQVLSKDNSYFLITEKTKDVKDILSKCGAVISEGVIHTNNTLFANITQAFENDILLFDKINTVITTNKDTLHHDDKWNIFRNFHNHFHKAKIKDKIAKELIIFQNTQGDYKPLCELHPHANEDAKSGILNHYQMKHSEKEFDNFSNIYEYTLKDKPNIIWNLFYENWEEIHLEDIEKKTRKTPKTIEKVYRDLEILYEQSNGKNSIKDLNFVYTIDGEFVTPSEVLYHKELPNFSEADYKKLTTFLSKNTDYQFIPFEHLQAFESCVSGYANPTSYKNLSDHFTTQEFNDIDKAEILLLQKLKTNNEAFFAHFVVKEEENKLRIKTKLKVEYQYFLEDSYHELNQFLRESNYYLLPKSLLEKFDGDISLLKESDDFANKLIDDYESEPALMELVYHVTPNVKRKYINKVLHSGFYLMSNHKKYDTKSFEARFIEVGVSLEMTENIKDKTFIDNRQLREFEWSDNISFIVDEETYVKFSLEDILPNKANGSKILEKVKSLFPHNIPSEKIFTQKNAPLKDIKADLFHSASTLFDDSQQAIKRVTFLVAYYLSEESKPDTKPTIPRLTILINPAIFEMFFQQGQKGLRKYQTYYQFDDFTPQQCLQSPNSSLLLDQEKLPDWVQNWLDTHKDKKKAQEFLEAIGVSPETHAAIEVRKALKKNERSNRVDSLVNYQEFCENTFEWVAQTQKNTINKGESNYNTLRNLIEGYTTEYELLPNYMLYLENENEYLYTERQTKDTLYFDRNKQIKRLVLGKNKYTQNLIDACSASKDFKQILKNNGIYPVYVKGDIIEEKAKNASEWTAHYYKEWKKDERVKYIIKIAHQPFPFKYLFQYNQQENLIEENPDGEIAMTEHDGFKTIYIYQEGFEEKSILKILQAHDENKEQEEDREQFFKNNTEKDLFAKLMSLALPKEEDTNLLKQVKEAKLQEKDLQSLSFIKNAGFENPQQIQNLINDNNKPRIELDRELSDEQKKRITENIEELLEITEKFSQEELQHFIDKQEYLKEIIQLPEEYLKEVSEKLKELVDLANKFSKEELEQILGYADILKNLLEQEKEATVNSITGFIGEMLTYYSLAHDLGEENIKHVSQTENKAEYDIEVILPNGKEYEIDTKTTVKTLFAEQNAIPLYVKLSQYRYVKQKKVDNYLIDRISLEDMQDDKIKGIKDKYQKMQKPLEEVKEELKEEIKQYMEYPENRQKYKNASFMFRINYEDFFGENLTL
ncbi:MAG: hypothetical protein EAZ55_03430 [Cytophagales bacterium]|nr:MAG: hypothetical protein EAZ55_03430 [Cytophagales bacterium]